METDILSPLPRPPTLTLRNAQQELHIRHPSLLIIKTQPYLIDSATAIHKPCYLIIYILTTSKSKKRNEATLLLTLTLPYPIPSTLPTTIDIATLPKNKPSITLHTQKLPLDFRPTHLLPPTTTQRQILLLAQDHFRILNCASEKGIPDVQSLSGQARYFTRSPPLVPSCICFLPLNHALCTKSIGGFDNESHVTIVGDVSGDLWAVNGGRYTVFEAGRGTWKKIARIGTRAKWVNVIGGFVVGIGELGRGVIINGKGLVKGFSFRDTECLKGKVLEGGDGIVVGGMQVRVVTENGDEIKVERARKIENGGREMKEVLKGIDSASYSCGIVKEWGQKWEDRVKGLSLAMLQKLNIAESKLDIKVQGSCRGRGTEWAGGEIGVCVVVTNNAEMRIGVGWGVQVSVQQGRSAFMSQFYQPLKCLTPSETQMCVFPFNVMSHNPLHVNTTLMHHILPSQCKGGGRPVLSVPQKLVVLDILHCASKCPDASPSLDYSRNFLPGSRLDSALSGSFPQPERLQTSRTRIGVTALIFDSVIGAWETALGAQIVIETIEQDGKSCTVILRAARLVMPFLRAAVLRRVVDSGLESDRKGRKAVTEAIVEGRRAVLQATDALVKIFRTLNIDPIASERKLEWGQSNSEPLLALKEKVLEAYEEWRHCTSSLGQ